MVRTWILFDTKVHTLTKTSADARKRKRSVTDQLMELIVRNSYEEVTLPQGTLVPRKQRRKSPITNRHGYPFVVTTNSQRNQNISVQKNARTNNSLS